MFNLPYQYYIRLNNFFLILQSKKGGLSAWEPAGAQEWLEVSIA